MKKRVDLTRMSNFMGRRKDVGHGEGEVLKNASCSSIIRAAAIRGFPR